ncbi:MAG: hypothetical protein WDN76_07905 [Alphaproteobacteria bacterium]
MRNAAFLLCLSASVVSPHAAAAADDGAQVFIKGAATQSASSPLSLPGADLSTQSGEAALLLDGDRGGLRYRVRAEGFARSGGAPDFDVGLKELSYGRRLNDEWSVSLGKQVRSWDSGLSFQPLGFFRKGLDIADPFDSEGRVEGLPMLVVTRLGARANVEAVVSEPFSDSLKAANERQWAVRISGDPAPTINAALILRQRQHADPGVGASASWAAGRLQVHADTFYGAAPVGISYLSLRQTPRLYTARPIIERNDRKAVLDAVLGLTWTATDYVELTAEWTHRGGGASDSDWSRLLDQIDFHRSALTGPSLSLAFANLAWISRRFPPAAIMCSSCSARRSAPRHTLCPRCSTRRIQAR